MSNEVTRTPAEVAADINSIKSHASAIYRAAIDVGKRSCIEIGRLLEEAKCLVPHGEWGKWLSENVDYSESTANNLMRCFKEFGDEQIDLFTGVSDADFFSILNQSQMLELLALPKEQRRDFVEERREEIESGKMSTRKMSAEIAKLRMENQQKDEAFEKAKGHIESLEKDVNELNAALDEERRKPAPEPIVQEVIVNQPSEEQLEAIRAAEEQRLRDEFETERAATVKGYEAKLTAAEKEKAKAVKEASEKARDAGELHEKLKKIEADHEAAMDKLKADHEKKLAEVEASYKKQIKASAAGADPSVVRVQIALEGFRREVRAVASILLAMQQEGETQKVDKLKAQVEATIGKILAEAGWTV